MALTPSKPILGQKVDVVFVGSCTNGRLEDLREAASVMRGRKVKTRTLVVAGSHGVKKAAEAEGLDRIFREAGAGVARAGLLDVPRHERGHTRARPVLRLDVEPELRGAPGARRAHDAREPGDGGSAAVSGAVADRAGWWRARKWNRPHHREPHGRHPAREHRHRPDHPGRFLKVTDKQGLRKALFSDWRYDADGSRAPSSS